MANFESAIPYIKKAEGGLSRATTDKASKNPSPYTYKGVKGWHTNKGITWTTFQSLAPKAGFEVNETNFMSMPDNVWLGIYKVGFWQPTKGDLYNSQAIANTVVDWAWAGGTGGAKKALIQYLSTKGIKADGYETIANGFNQLVKKDGESKAFNDLIDERKRWFKALNQPANEKGWLARMETLRKEGSAILGKVYQSTIQAKEVVKKNPYKVGALTVAIVLSIYIGYRLIKKNK